MYARSRSLQCGLVALGICALNASFSCSFPRFAGRRVPPGRSGQGAVISAAVRWDLSVPLAATASKMKAEEAICRSPAGQALPPGVSASPGTDQSRSREVESPPDMSAPAGAAAVEQTTQGDGPAPAVIASFDGLGLGFKGPQGEARFNNPSDNSLAAGPDHIFQIVNSRLAIYTKKGKLFPSTGKVLMGPVPTNALFAGFGGSAERNNNGD
ncbi:MAG TPA: hypothetical protein VGS41_08570, partial [Chthonomonadales bacterium]|nr:hypothetical protein [Chthonomonadales bacterium]